MSAIWVAVMQMFVQEYSRMWCIEAFLSQGWRSVCLMRGLVNSFIPIVYFFLSFLSCHGGSSWKKNTVIFIKMSKTYEDYKELKQYLCHVWLQCDGILILLTLQSNLSKHFPLDVNSISIYLFLQSISTVEKKLHPNKFHGLKYQHLHFK